MFLHEGQLVLYTGQAGRYYALAEQSGTMRIHLNLWGDFNDDGSVGFDDLLTLVQRQRARDMIRVISEGPDN